MATWTLPTAASAYADWPTLLQERVDSLAVMFDDGVTWGSLPNGAIRWNASNDRFEKWASGGGGSWGNLSTSLTAILKIANNLSELTATAATARTNLGLGSIAVLASPLPVANGGTAGTDQASGRTGLGLGTISTQAASAVAITGGSLSGLTALTMNSSTTLDMTSGGTISNVATVTSGAAITFRTTAAVNLIFQTNSTTRFTIKSSGMTPGVDNTYDIGESGTIVRDVYADRIRSGKYYNAGDLVFQVSGTTRWVMDSGAGLNFRPNANSTQDLGHASYRWRTFYVDSINGAQTSIHMSDSNDVHIRYLANTGGDHKFYSALGGVEAMRIESTGKFYPIAVGRQDYTVSGVTTRRTINGAETLAQVIDAVGTITNDLIALGLFA